MKLTLLILAGLMVIGACWLDGTASTVLWILAAIFCTAAVALALVSVNPSD